MRFLLALVAGAITLRAHAAPPTAFSTVQAWTQIADVVVLGTLRKGTPHAVDVKHTLRGDLGKTRRVQISVPLADDPLDKLAGQTALFFLRHTGKSYELSYYERYGIIKVTGYDAKAKADLWLTDRKKKDPLSVDDLVKRLESLPAARVAITADVPRSIPRAQTVVPVTFTYTNLGKDAVNVLPPSFHFDAVIAQRKAGGSPTRGVGQWPFLAGVEALTPLPPGSPRSFKYEVPLATLGIDKPGRYELILRLDAYRPTESAARTLARADLTDIWLGGMAETTRRLDVSAR